MKAPLTKYYFINQDDELCYNLADIKHEFCGETSAEVYEAIPVKIDNIFYCDFFETCGEKGYDFDKCGKECRAYIPRNGKSGCCKYYSKRLFEPGNKITLTLR